MVKVLIVDDSGVARELLNHILSSDPGIAVIGTAKNGQEALDAVEQLRPHVVTMDVIMPGMDGWEATRRIMETNPVPIIIVSAGPLPEEVDKTWRAIEAGAVSQLVKPGLADLGRPGGAAEKLIQTVKIMAQVKVVRRWRRAKDKAVVRPVPLPRRTVVSKDVRVVAIGASTGGPTVLQTIFSGLPREFPVPILLVQHIAAGFAKGFVDWLNRSSALKLHLAENRTVALPGNIYVAPDRCHMKIDGHNRISLSTDEPENGLRPSVSVLFRSVAASFREMAVGVLLTGMGRDGADELKLMKDNGAVTIAQDKESCIVYGMPGEAMKLHAAKYFLPPEKITEMLRNIVMK